MTLRGWYSCAPLLPLDTAVFSCFDGGREGMIMWYCCAPSLPLETAVFSRFDGGVEGILLCAPVHPLSILLYFLP